MGQRFNLWRPNVKRNLIFTRLPVVYNILHRLLWKFSYLYHSYNVKFWVRIRVLRRRRRSANVFLYPAVSVWTAGKHGWEGYQRWKSFWRLVHGRQRRVESNTGKFRLVCAVLFSFLHCHSFTDLWNELLFGPDVVNIIERPTNCLGFVVFNMSCELGAVNVKAVKNVA